MARRKATKRKRKPSQLGQEHELPLPPGQESPEIQEFMEIGGSPVPGVTLLQIIRGHKDEINGIAWSPGGCHLASASSDGTTRIWDVAQGKCTAIVKASTGRPTTVAWSGDGCKLSIGEATGSAEYNTTLWDFENNKLIRTISGADGGRWSPDNKKIALSHNREMGGPSIRIYEKDYEQESKILKGHDELIWDVQWFNDGSTLASSSYDNTIIIWNTKSRKTIRRLEGHKDYVYGLALSRDGSRILSASKDKTIRIWDFKTGNQIATIEGHTNFSTVISLSADERVLASKSLDGTVRLWDCATWEHLASITELHTGNWTQGIDFNPKSPTLATLGGNYTIRIWKIDYDILLRNQFSAESVHYTTAKLVLAGDSGVGKTGLGWRLAHGVFKEHSSTHGQQFWVIPQLGEKRKDGTECEAVLWDLAGQHIYRSIHSIFLDDVDLSLILFDPTNRQEPLKGAEFWLGQLKGKNRLPPSVLVGARLDRGAPVLSQQELIQFCQRNGISGDYIGTSAKSGDGLDKLLEIVKSQIPWEQKTKTVTTKTFKLIKEYVLSLKEKPDRKDVLVRPVELRQQLMDTDKDWQFSDSEMMTAVGHLQNHGYVAVLKSSAGDEYILLSPDLLATLASSIVLIADKNPRELGAINETELLQGKYSFDELKGLEKIEQQILLDAAVLRFMEHSICFRERMGGETLLIFPGLIKQKRPLKDNFESNDDVSYIVQGRVENIYSALVVLLGYSPTFTRINQWQNQAQYEMGVGETCGFRLIEEREGELELVLYYSTTMPLYGRKLFLGLFESFLYKRDVDVTRFPPVLCPNKHRLERAAVVKRAREGKRFIFCDECGEKTILPEIEAPETLGALETRQIECSEALAKLRNVYETHLTRVKSFRRDRMVPRCYISHTEDCNDWAKILIHDLRDAGIIVLENNQGLSRDDFILEICTPEYKLAWDDSTAFPGEDTMLIRKHLNQEKPLIIPLLREGDARTSIPNELYRCKAGDFRIDTFYSVSLFDLVLSLYAIPLNREAFKSLRDDLRNQWKRMLEHYQEVRQEIFVSYAWGEEREAIVEKLDKTFQKRGVTIVRDKRDLGFKGRIKEFMETIGQGKAIILVISEKYLKSPNCCFELVQIAKHGNFADRIFPIILSDTKIFDPVDRARYVEHWENKKDELDDIMKHISAANMEGFREDIDLYAEIRTLLPRLMDVLKDMNSLTPEMHADSDFSQIFDAVMMKLEE